MSRTNANSISRSSVVVRSSSTGCHQGHWLLIHYIISGYNTIGSSSVASVEVWNAGSN